MFIYFVSKLKYMPLRSILIKERRLVISRLFSNSEAAKPSGFIYEPDFTTAQQKYILQRLNEADELQLGRFNLPKNRIKKLEIWRKKNGKFNSLIDLLDVDGLGVKTIDKLCKNILQRENDLNETVKEKPSKSRGHFLTPTLNEYQSKDLNSAVGVHLYATGISWAKIKRTDNFLSDWDSFEFNLGAKKMTPADALQLIINTSNEIPTADVYIFEAPIAVTPTAQQSPISVAAYVQRVQLLSMLVTLLSTSSKHNSSYIQTQEKNNFSFEPKVFFIRHRLPARLFQTLVGTERVSAATTVANILQNKITEKLVYTPISLDEDLKVMYDEQAPVTKEVLGQALLLTMAFMDICVYQVPSSLKFVSSHSR